MDQSVARYFIKMILNHIVYFKVELLLFRTLPGLLLDCAILGLCGSQWCIEVGDSGCSVEELASLQRLFRTFH